jgi:hypothetical protein
MGTQHSKTNGHGNVNGNGSRTSYEIIAVRGNVSPLSGSTWIKPQTILGISAPLRGYYDAFDAVMDGRADVQLPGMQWTWRCYVVKKIGATDLYNIMYPVSGCMGFITVRVSVSVA